jgi:predicted amino acid-binding ACT domain protein
MVFARRTPENPGKGMLFVSPIKGARATRAAQAGGLGKPQTIHSVRIEGGDKPGLGAAIARTLGRAGVSFRGISAIAIGSKFVSYVACDSAEDQAKAIAALKKLK